MALLTGVPVCADGLPPAVGRISYGAVPAAGAAICSGVLVAPDLVLTAAHCVREGVESPETIWFSAGWSVGAMPPVQRQGAEVILLPAGASAGLEQLLQDVALVVLETPLPAATYPPLPVGAAIDGPLTLAAFDRSAPHRAPTPALCVPLATPPGLLGLDCPVVSGNSGAPLMQRDGRSWQVVAVMVASARGGGVRSWAVLPPAPLRLRIAVQPK